VAEGEIAAADIVAITEMLLKGALCILCPVPFIKYRWIY